MLTSVGPAPPSSIVYPDSDGLPMADNSKQFRWIIVFAGNLAARYRNDDQVLVGGNQLWYPAEGDPQERAAPDVYVVFGRPKGDRGSYKQWEEDGIPLTVVFEILSPGNTPLEMADKLDFYDRHGAEEYYLYDPDANQLAIYVRRGEVLRRVRPAHGFTSPRLGIRFELSGSDLFVYHRDGRRFLTFEELTEERDRAEQRADHAERRAARLAELTRKVLLQQATPDERQELERLVAPPAETP